MKKNIQSTGSKNDLPTFDLLKLEEKYGWIKNMLK